MAWTAATRGDYVRPSDSYTCDVTNRECALIWPLLPAVRPGWRPRTTCPRQVVNAIIYLLQAGCQWWMLPRDFPPRSTAHGHFRGLDHCRGLGARPRGRHESPSAAIIDSQSVEIGSEAPEMVGYDAAKRSRAASGIWSPARSA
jgi:transposase